MVIHNFRELETRLPLIAQQALAVVSAADRHSLEAVLDPRLEQAIQPVLIGDSSAILQLLGTLKHRREDIRIIHAENEESAARIGVDLVRSGQVSLIMKGNLQTRDFLKPIVSRDTGIIEQKTLSHVVLTEVERYHKILVTTDGGMVPEPDYATKISITENAIAVLERLGYKKPKVAVLAAAEVVNSRIKSSQEAYDLMCHFRQIASERCEIDGPISFDLAVSKEIAIIKEYDSPVAGDADLLVGPDMTTVNILGKSLVIFGNGKMAGIISGARVPIVMTSRGSSTQEKYYSIILGLLLSPAGGIG